MSYILLLLLLLISNGIVLSETRSKLDRIQERLKKSAIQLSIEILHELPDAGWYLNNHFMNNLPHRMNLKAQLTKNIQEWSPRLLALDPTCPYYFSTSYDEASPEKDLNILSYLQALEANRTAAHPFVGILPQSYRTSLPVFSILKCSELVYSSPSFFHNLELIIGPGQSELPIECQSNSYPQLYCSLYGWPHFILLNQPKELTTTCDAGMLLSKKDLADFDFISTSLPPGDCLFLPPDWVRGIHMNNSISMVLTMRKLKRPQSNEDSYEDLPCTHTGTSMFGSIDFAIADKFNISEIGLIVYFYQYLNPPMFNQQYDREEFFSQVQQDKNITQLIMQWTPELTDLIKNKLFEQLDINGDGSFSVDDYFHIKRHTVHDMQQAIYGTLDRLREIVLLQYNELSESIAKVTQQLGNHAVDDELKQAIEEIMMNLPEQVKERLQENNIDLDEVLNRVQTKKPKRPKSNKQTTREDDASILFNKQEDENIVSAADIEQEEEITAEPIVKDNELHRTDL